MIYDITTGPSTEETAHALPKSNDNKIRSPGGLIETELIRERLYEAIRRDIKSWLSDRGCKSELSNTQISHLLLRYIFNKKATTSCLASDPVFIIERSSIARRQLERDLDAINGRELANLIDDKLLLAAREMVTAEIETDESVIYSTTMDGTLSYRDREQPDFSRLAQSYGPDYYNAAYALGIRYSYLGLGGHDLSRAYKDETERSSSDPLACECFASAFNHYFDRYYSAFPDLETLFGSRGCFFKLNWEQEPDNMTYYVNPPFDESLVELSVDCITNVLTLRLVRGATFVFTVPGAWTGFTALEKLKRSPWRVKAQDYQKGKLPFINYMVKEECRIFYPADICEITLKSAVDNEFSSSVTYRADRGCCRCLGRCAIS